MNPARYVVDQFGGIRPTARALDCAVTNVFRWVHSKDGSIPAKYQKQILKIAAKRKLPITANDLIYGR